MEQFNGKNSILAHPTANDVPEGGMCLLGRHDCIKALQRIGHASADTRRAYSIFWLDIDRFKRFNTSLGLAAGDKVLDIIKTRLNEASQGQGHVARMGDDEFVMILPDCEMPQAEQRAHQLLRLVSQPVQIANLRIRPTVSMGVAVMRGYRNPFELLELSDRAMHEAKQRGGDQFVFAPDLPCSYDDTSDPHREDLFIEETLHAALEIGGLYLEYQPIIRTDDGSLEMVEALMRCRVNDTALSPARFIPVAERTGLIVRLGDWTLVTASQFVARMLQRGHPTKVAVNVSRAQLISPQFSQTLHAATLLSDVASDWVELEITESLFMDQTEIVRNNLHAVMEAGFKVAIDDFGTGYSCLASLKDLPAHKLKLDRAFILDIQEDKRSFAIVRAVVRMALDLDMIVVAEGVETQAQYDALCQAGVTAIQGYFLAQPMTEANLSEWLFQQGKP